MNYQQYQHDELIAKLDRMIQLLETLQPPRWEPAHVCDFDWSATAPACRVCGKPAVQVNPVVISGGA
jgi:hypothetical protein